MIIKLHSLKIRAGFSNLVKILPHNYLVVIIGSFLYSYKNGALLTEVSKLKLKSFKLLKLDYDPGHSKSLKSFLKTVCSMSLSARIGSLATVCNMSLLITPFIRLSELFSLSKAARALPGFCGDDFHLYARIGSLAVEEKLR